MKSNSLFMSLTVVVSLLAGTPQLHAQTPAQNNQAKALFDKGWDLCNEGNFAEAAGKFREALHRYPRAEGSDRTSYYLITALVRLGRGDEAHSEIQNFYRAYPHSTWADDVEETRLRLFAPHSAFVGTYHVGSAPVPPAQPRVVAPPAPMTVRVTASPSLEQERFRIIVQNDAQQGIAMARERLKTNPSDPVVISNFPVIAGSGSPQAFPFFVVLAGKGPSPNTRRQAEFSLGRLKNDNDAVGKGLLEIVKEKDGVPTVANVFTRINPATTRTVLYQIVEVPSVEKLVALEKVYRVTSAQPVRENIVQSVGSMPETAARDFLTEVAKTERNMSVRLLAIHTLSTRADVDLKTLDEIFETLKASPARPGLRGQISRGATREFRDESTVQLAP